MSADDVARVHGAAWAGEDARYLNSPFLPLKRMSSRSKGARFEEIADAILTGIGHSVLRADSSQYDRIVDGLRVEIKGSFLWSGADTFRWQQIRIEQGYDLLLLLAFYPDRVEMWAADRDAVHDALAAQDADGNWPHNQHGGKTTNSGAFFIDGLPGDFAWLRPATELLPRPDGETAN